MEFCNGREYYKKLQQSMRKEEYLVFEVTCQSLFPVDLSRMWNSFGQIITIVMF